MNRPTDEKGLEYTDVPDDAMPELTPIGKTFQNMEAFLRDPRNPPAAVGYRLFEYFMESGHGGWEGYSAEDLKGVAAFCEDFMTYMRSINQSYTF